MYTIVLIKMYLNLVKKLLNEIKPIFYKVIKLIIVILSKITDN